jgi:SAM-dependent methyltransferase
MAEASLLGAVERYYSGRFAEHGASPQGVDWNSAESQELRFAQLLTVVGDVDDVSLVDYGCGYGALVRFLNARGLRYTYCGFDLSEPMLAHARQELGESERLAFTSDPAAVPASDYALASGIFNVRLTVDDERWLAYVLETVERLDELGTRGFAFNLLTSYSDADRMRPDLYYGDPCFFFDLCKRRYSRNVALLHDYGLYEFTIVVRK